MDCPTCQASSLDVDGLAQIVACGVCRGEWLANRTAGTVCRDNLVYLPFAAHLADEDAEDEPLEKAA